MILKYLKQDGECWEVGYWEREEEVNQERYYKGLAQRCIHKNLLGAK